MAESNWRKNAPDYDGRFGERFDDELKVPGIAYTVVGIVVVTLLGMLITWGMEVAFRSTAASQAAAPSPLREANERRLPPSPQLQSHPESELVTLRQEMAHKLHGFGWVDAAQGTVRIPIEQAIDLLLARQPAATSIPASPGATAVIHPAAAAPAAVPPTSHEPQGAGH